MYRLSRQLAAKSMRRVTAAAIATQAGHFQSATPQVAMPQMRSFHKSAEKGGNLYRASGAAAPRGASVIPSFEIYNIQDEAEKGKLIRVNFRDKQVYVSLYPQLGPRKTDPNDPTPQFDLSRRSTTRFRLHEIAECIAVMEGKQTEAKIETRFHNLTFSRIESEDGFKFAGTITRANADPVTWDLEFAKTHAVMLYRFFESSLVEGFGFRAYQQQELAAKRKAVEALKK